MDENTRPQKLAAEVLGTALLVFIGVGAVPATLIVNGNAPFTMADLGMISFAFGMVVVATVYALGHISGNHINPAVTLALAVTGKFPWKEVPGYIAAQVVGATLGALAIVGVLGAKAHQVGLGVASFNKSLHVGSVQGFFAEFVGTFILVFVIFGVIHRKAASGFAGVAIGLVVFAAIIPVGAGDIGRHQPGTRHRPDAGPARLWRFCPVGAATGLRRSRAVGWSRRRRRLHGDRPHQARSIRHHRIGKLRP